MTQPTTDPRYDHLTCGQCGQVYQQIDWHNAAHQLTCGFPIPRPATPIETDEKGEKFERIDHTRYYVACSFCQRMKEGGTSFFPNHHASSRCESGKHNHCSCDSCF